MKTSRLIQEPLEESFSRVKPRKDPTGSPTGDEDPPPHNSTSPPRAASTRRGFSQCQGHPSVAPHRHWRPTSPCQSSSSPTILAARLPRHRAVSQRTTPSPCKHAATLSRAFPFREEGNSARRRWHGSALLGATVASPAMPRTPVSSCPTRHRSHPNTRCSTVTSYSDEQDVPTRGRLRFRVPTPCQEDMRAPKSHRLDPPLGFGTGMPAWHSHPPSSFHQIRVFLTILRFPFHY